MQGFIATKMLIKYVKSSLPVTRCVRASVLYEISMISLAMCIV